MEKIITVDGREVKMKASALVPRLYRFKFGRDMMRDMAQLQKVYAKAASLPEDATDEERAEAQLSMVDLTIFENLAYIMAKHADSSLPDTAEEWLDSFSMFSIYEVLPEILQLWGMSCSTTSSLKKNKGDSAGAERGYLYVAVCRAGAIR